MNNAQKKSLVTVKKYKNDYLVKYFSLQYKVTDVESSDLFNDLKLWLWFCANQPAGLSAHAIPNEMRIIDLYWHSFLIFTKDYLEFCTLCLGKIVYHNPQISMLGFNDAILLKTDPDKLIQRNIDIIREGMESVNNLLGPAVLERWYKTIPEKYGAKFAKRDWDREA